jgi:hypothetical protein
MTDVVIPKHQKTENTKSTLRWAALFLGELRDGLTMVRPNAASRENVRWISLAC